MKTDILLLERDCPTCGVIKATLSFDAMTDDEFRGKDGQEFLVIASQSNSASITLTTVFGHQAESVPLLMTHDGLVISDASEIKVRLEEQGMSV
jgi:hypothetical protein